MLCLVASGEILSGDGSLERSFLLLAESGAADTDFDNLAKILYCGQKQDKKTWIITVFGQNISLKKRLRQITSHSNAITNAAV